MSISIFPLNPCCLLTAALLGPKKPLKRRRLDDHGSLSPENCLEALQPLPLALKCGVVNPCSCCNRPVPLKPGCSIFCARYAVLSSHSIVPYVHPSDQVREADLQRLFTDVHPSSAFSAPNSHVEQFPHSPKYTLTTIAPASGCDVSISRHCCGRQVAPSRQPAEETTRV